MTRKTILIALLISLGLAGKTYCQTYLDEAVKISANATANGANKKLTFTIKDGVPVVNDQVQFQKMATRLVNKIKAQKALVSNVQRAAAKTTGNDTSGAVSVKPKSGTGVKSAAPQADTSVDNAAINTELAFILFLEYDNNPADYKAVADSGKFPKHFSFTDSGQLTANFQADLGSSVLNFNVAQIAYGLTDFIIKRAKQEMVDAYLSGWYNKLSADPIVSPLIPKTLSVFKAFNDDNSTSLAQYGNKWKAAFHEDFRNLPLQLQDETYVSMVLGKAGVSDADAFEITPIITGGDELAYNLYLKKHLVNVLTEMAGKYIAEAQPGTQAPLFKRLVVLNDILLTASGTMDNSGSSYSPPNISALRTMSGDAWQIVLKLLYLRNSASLQYGLNMTADDKLAQLFIGNKNINQFIALFQQTNTLITAYQTMLTAKASDRSNKLSFDDVRKMFDLSFQVIDNAEAYLKLFDPNAACMDATYTTNIKPYFTFLSQVGEGISTQQYADVLDGTLGIVNKALSTTSPTACTTITAKTKITAKSANVAIDKTGLITAIGYLQRYGSFMINILDATDSSAVEKALDELVPEGDYKAKNDASFTVSLSSFPGIFLGGEVVSKNHTGTATASSTAFAPGVYLPIGLDVDLGFKWGKQANNKPRYGSIGLLFQAIDLGAVLDYRVNNGDQTVSTAPNIALKQFLSPGAALILHLPNSPLVLGGGINYSPGLRTISQAGEANYQANALRYGIFLAVDVTFFNFFASKK